MREVQTRCIRGSGASITLIDFVDRDTQSGMIVRGGSIIDIRCIACSSNSSKGDSNQNLKHDCCLR